MHKMDGRGLLGYCQRRREDRELEKLSRNKHPLHSSKHRAPGVEECRPNAIAPRRPAHGEPWRTAQRFAANEVVAGVIARMTAGVAESHRTHRARYRCEPGQVLAVVPGVE